MVPWEIYSYHINLRLLGRGADWGSCALDADATRSGSREGFLLVLVLTEQPGLLLKDGLRICISGRQP